MMPSSAPIANPLTAPRFFRSLITAAITPQISRLYIVCGPSVEVAATARGLVAAK
jgi:hypothetical protein